MSLAMKSGPSFISLSVVESSPGALRAEICATPQRFDIGDALVRLAVREEDGETEAPFHVHVFDPSGSGNEGRSAFESTFRAYGFIGEPHAMAWGDFDEDGTPDAVVASSGQFEADGFANPLQILLGRRDGSLGPETVIQDAWNLYGVVVADVNRDSHLDLIVGATSIFVRHGRGDGSFENAIGLAEGSNYGSLRVADVNEDGWPDVVVMDRAAQQSHPFVLLNDGTTTWRNRLDLSGGEGRYATELEVADVDGDGHLDIVAGDYELANITRWEGRGDGTFGPPEVLLPESPSGRYMLGDVDGDGDLDAAVLGAGFAGVRILENAGEAGFIERHLIPSDPGGHRIAFGDMNADGIIDVVTAHDDRHRVEVSLGRGGFDFSPATMTPSGAAPATLFLRDVDFDGRLDIVVLDRRGSQVVIHSQNSDGTYGATAEVPTPGPAEAIVSGDWNGDGLADAAVVAWGTGVMELLVTQGSTMVPWSTATLPGATTRVRSIDLDGDHRPEIVAAVAGEPRLFVVQPELRPPAVTTIDWDANIDDFDAIDWNRDGRIDLIVTTNGSSRGSTVVLARTAAGGYEGIALTWGGTSVAAGDFNGDGNWDVAIAGGGSSDPVRVAWGDATGGLAEPYWYYENSRNFAAVLAYEPDAYGRHGLLAFSPETNSVSLFRGAADLTLPLQGVLRLGAGAIPRSLADFNGDGAADLMVSNGYANTFSLFPGNGDGTLGTRQDFGTGRGPIGVAFGDRDGDGRLDLMVADSGDHRIGLHRNLGVFRVNRPPVAQAGGPYAGVAGSPVEFEGSASADPEGDLLTYRWSFGDGRDGVGPNPSHTYVTGGTFHVELTVGDGQFEDVDSTTAVVDAALEVRLFRSAGSVPIIVGGGPPQSCVHIEPLVGAFAVEDIDLATLQLTAVVGGEADSISAVAAKHGMVADSDRNGVPDFAACFARDDVTRLLLGLVGRVGLPVTIKGRLTTGAFIQGSTTLSVIARGGGLAAFVRPQPISRVGAIGFRLASPGITSIRLFDTQGRLVRTLLHRRTLAAGYHEFPLETDGQGRERMPSGVFYFRIDSPEGSETGKVLIAR